MRYALFLAILMSGASSQAAVVSFTFTGQVDDVVFDNVGAGVNVGDLVTGTITYDLDAGPVPGTISSGTDPEGNTYDTAEIGGILTITTNVGGNLAQSSTSLATVTDFASISTAPAQDQVGLGNFGPGTFGSTAYANVNQSLFFFGPPGTINSLALPADFAGFLTTFGNFEAENGLGDGVAFSFTITSVEAVAVTPEPATLVLWSLGMAGMSIAGMRRRWTKAAA